jgi:hypothetical protein
VEVQAGPSLDALTLRARLSESCAVGRLTAPLRPGVSGRFDEGATLDVALDGGALASASDAAVLAGANALAVRSDAGDWEVLQFATAEMTGPGAWRLTRLLRGQLGTEAAAVAGAACGGAAVLLTPDLGRAQVSASERGLPLLWRIAPSGGSALATTTVDFAWMGVAYRPFSPVRLSATARDDGGLDLAWIRRTRTRGDSWEGEEVPLSEESESYRVDVLTGDGSAVLRSAEVAAPAFAYDGAALAADFPAGRPASVTVRVRQVSAIWGPGATLQQVLWL